MKVLFAVSNENISEAIIQKYQSMYKEIISSKNVYYFNAILKELQRDKTYDRVVISEDLEQYVNTDYEQMEMLIKRDAVMTVVGDLEYVNINGVMKTIIPVIVQ